VAPFDLSRLDISLKLLYVSDVASVDSLLIVLLSNVDIARIRPLNIARSVDVCLVEDACFLFLLFEGFRFEVLDCADLAVSDIKSSLEDDVTAPLFSCSTTVLLLKFDDSLLVFCTIDSSVSWPFIFLFFTDFAML